MFRFFREQKLLAALMLVSLLVIIVGIIMISYSNTSARQNEVIVQDQKEQAVVGAMTSIANMAGQELHDTKVSPAQDVPVGDVIPQESLDHVAKLNGRVPDVGSNDWCEVMMVKSAKEWTTEEQEIFAKNCL